MILDNECQMADALSLITDSGSTIASTAIDTRGASGVGGSGQVEVLCRIGTAVDSTGDGASLTWVLQSSDSSTFGSGNQTDSKTDAIAEATMVANYELMKVRVPESAKRYVRITATSSGEAVTAGTFSAWLILDRQVEVAGT